MSSGERPIGAATGKQSDTEALCQPSPPPSGSGQAPGTCRPATPRSRQCPPTTAPRVLPHNSASPGGGWGAEVGSYTPSPPSDPDFKVGKKMKFYEH